MRVIVVGGHTRNIGKTSVAANLIREFRFLNWTAVKISQYGHGVCSLDGKACHCAPTRHGFALTEEQDPHGRADTCRWLAAGAKRSLWLRVRQGQLGSAFSTLQCSLNGDQYVLIESNSILAFLQPLLYLVVLDGTKQDFKDSTRKFLHLADALVCVDLPLSGISHRDTLIWGEAWKGAGFNPPVTEPSALTHRRPPLPQAGEGLGGEGYPAGLKPAPFLPIGEKCGLTRGVWHGIEPQQFARKPLFPVRATEYFSPDLCRFVEAKLELMD